MKFSKIFLLVLFLFACNTEKKDSSLPLDIDKNVDTKSLADTSGIIQDQYIVVMTKEFATPISELVHKEKLRSERVDEFAKERDLINKKVKDFIKKLPFNIPDSSVLYIYTDGRVGFSFKSEKDP